MDLRSLLMVFGTIFVAELGDKTQLATFLFASDREVSRLAVFAGAALALIVTSGIAVLLGGAVSRLVGERWLRAVAGSGFIAVGVWTLLRV